MTGQGRRSDAVLAAATVVLSAVLVVLLASSEVDRFGPYAALLAPSVLLWTVRRRLQPPYLSPVWILTLITSAAGVAGYALRSDLNGKGGGAITLTMNDVLAERTAYLFAGLAGAIAVGAVVVAVWRPQRDAGFEFPHPTPSTRTWFLLASVVPALLLVVDLGTELLSRPEHLAGTAGTNIFVAVGQLGIGAVAVAGYLAGVEQGGRRLAAVTLAVVYVLLFFALSSRRLSMAPMLFAVGLALSSRRRGKVLILGGILTVATLPLPLFLRGFSDHGLFPYLEGIGRFSYGAADWLSSVNNVLLAFPITAHTAFVRSPLPIEWLWIELNPAPGSMAGWYDIAPFMGLNAATPFSMVGELGSYGPGAVIGVGVGVGMVLTYLDARVGHYIRSGAPFVAVAVAGMSAFFAVTALQYSTRTFSRLLLYVVVVDVAVRLWRGRQARQAEEPPTYRELIEARAMDVSRQRRQPSS